MWRNIALVLACLAIRVVFAAEANIAEELENNLFPSWDNSERNFDGSDPATENLDAHDAVASPVAGMENRFADDVDFSLEGYDHALVVRSLAGKVSQSAESIDYSLEGYDHHLLSARDQHDVAASSVQKQYGNTVDISLNGYDHTLLAARDEESAVADIDYSLEGYDHDLAARHMYHTLQSRGAVTVWKKIKTWFDDAGQKIKGAFTG